MAEFREHRRLIIAEVAQPVCRKLVPAHRRYQTCDLTRAARHQRTLESRESETVKHTRSNAYHVLCSRADLASD